MQSKTENPQDQRWYRRHDSQAKVLFLAEVEIEGRVLNLSDAGLLASLLAEGDDLPLRNGQTLEMIVIAEDGQGKQKVTGEITRLAFDEQRGIWLAAIEVVGAWEVV